MVPVTEKHMASENTKKLISIDPMKGRCNSKYVGTHCQQIHSYRYTHKSQRQKQSHRQKHSYRQIFIEVPAIVKQKLKVGRKGYPELRESGAQAGISTVSRPPTSLPSIVYFPF